MSVNKVLLIGRVGKDPEKKFLATGTALTTFTMATSEKWKDKQGQWQEKTEWHNIKCWGKTAETVGEHIKKGSTLYVEGKIETTSSEKDGQKRYYTNVVMDKFQFVGGKPKQGNGQTSMSYDLPKQDYKPEANVNYTNDDIPW